MLPHADQRALTESWMRYYYIYNICIVHINLLLKQMGIASYGTELVALNSFPHCRLSQACQVRMLQ